MKNSKISPKEPMRHCDPDVSPGFSENSDAKNGGIQPFFKVVCHSDPSVPISVRMAFSSE